MRKEWPVMQGMPCLDQTWLQMSIKNCFEDLLFDLCKRTADRKGRDCCSECHWSTKAGLGSVTGFGMEDRNDCFTSDWFALCSWKLQWSTTVLIRTAQACHSGVIEENLVMSGLIGRDSPALIWPDHIALACAATHRCSPLRPERLRSLWRWTI